MPTLIFAKRTLSAVLGVVIGLGAVALVHANTNVMTPISNPPAQNVFLPITVNSDLVQTIKSRLIIDSGTNTFDLDVPSGPTIVQGLYSTGQVIFGGDVYHGANPLGGPGSNPNARLQVAALAHGVSNSLLEVCVTNQGVWEICSGQTTPTTVYTPNSCDNSNGNWTTGSGQVASLDSTLPYCAPGVTYGDPAGSICAAGSTPANGSVCTQTQCQTVDSDTPASVGASCYTPASCTQALTCSTDSQCNGGGCLGYQAAAGAVLGECKGIHTIGGSCTQYGTQNGCDTTGQSNGNDCEWTPGSSSVSEIFGSCECDPNSCAALTGTSCTASSQCGAGGTGQCNGIGQACSQTDAQFCEGFGDMGTCLGASECGWNSGGECEANNPAACHAYSATPGVCGCI